MSARVEITVTARHPIIGQAAIYKLGNGRGFRAGFREWRFGIPMDHIGDADSAHGALLRAAAHMARVNETPAAAAILLRTIASEIEAGE